MFAGPVCPASRVGGWPRVPNLYRSARMQAAPMASYSFAGGGTRFVYNAIQVLHFENLGRGECAKGEIMVEKSQ